MIRFLSLFAMAAAITAFSASASISAADKEDAKEVKLEGKICCGKCELGQSDKCAVTIVVEKEGKKTTYWLDTAASKKHHAAVCQEVKPGTIVGTVKKDGDKMVVTVKSLEFTK